MAKDYNVLDELTPKTVELHRAIFDKGYEQGFQDGKLSVSKASDNYVSEQCDKAMQIGIEIGRDEAWECLKKITFEKDKGGLTFTEIAKIFDGKCLSTEILENYSASETIEKIKTWEEKQKQTDDMKNCKWFRVENKNGSEGYRCDNPKNSFNWCHHVCEYFEGKTDEIEIGDEVICYGTNIKKIVVHIERSEDNTYYTCIGGPFGASTENDKNGKPIKTGKHYNNIDEIWEFLQ